MNNQVMLGNSADILFQLPENSIDLTVTSPPYDYTLAVREYGKKGWDQDVFKKVVEGLFRVTKPGGVVVWVVNDTTVDGSETGYSFEQALYFKRCFFNLHDTMLYLKNSFAFPSANRYHQVFEYMFVFSKGKPKTFNPIKDRENIYGLPWGKNTKRQSDGTLKEVKMKDTYEKYGMRHNVWKYNVGNSFAYPKNSLQKEHPASFPMKLVEDHIKSWSNEEDVVLDPFAGSGTVGVVASKLNRNYVLIEVNENYYDLIQRRLKLEGEK